MIRTQELLLLLVVAVAMVCVFPIEVASHAKLICPKPRSEISGIKSGPCGFGSISDPAFTQTVISPGPFTVYFMETIVHSGAPYRIALSRPGVDDFESCVLLDHIPHFDGGKVKDIYGITVNIPDFSCDNCALQLIQVMTDKVSGQCTFDPRQPSGGDCFSNYFSCANVKINGNGAFDAAKCTRPTEFAQSYLYRTGEQAEWTRSGYLKNFGPDSVRIPVLGTCSSLLDGTSFTANGTYVDDGTPPSFLEGDAGSAQAGMNAGAVLGVVAGILMIVVGGVIFYRRRRDGKLAGANGFNRFNDDESPVPPATTFPSTEMNRYPTSTTGGGGGGV